MKKLLKLGSLITVLLLSLSLLAGCDGMSPDEMPEDTFAGDPGITAFAEVCKNEIDMLDVKITVTNTSGKEINGLRFCASLLDGKGNVIDDTVNQIAINFLDNVSIAADETTTFDVMISQRATETIELHLMYVSCADGSEWGDKNAGINTVISLAPTFPVTIVEATE